MKRIGVSTQSAGRMRGFLNVEPSGVESNCWGFKGLRKPALSDYEVCKVALLRGGLVRDLNLTFLSL